MANPTTRNNTEAPSSFIFYFREVWRIQQPEKIQKRTELRGKKERKRRRPTVGNTFWTCDSKPELKIQCKILKMDRGIAELPFFSSWLDLTYGIEVWWYLLMGVELGNATFIALSSPLCLSVFSTFSQVQFWSKTTFFFTKCVSKKMFYEFSRISRWDRVGNKNTYIFHLNSDDGVRVSAPNFL